jgi:hypothetical protein
MIVEKIEDVNVHGGSIRVYIRNTKSTDFTLQNLNNTREFISKIKLFEDGLKSWKEEFLSLYYTLKKENKKIWGYGASGRTNIILSFLGIG